jgi:hypothetical protein
VRSKPFVIGFLAAVAVVAAVSAYVSMTIDKVEKTVTAVVSPDGRHKAVRLTVARGGAALFCFDTIAIFLSVYPDNFAESDSAYEIYGAPCAAPDKRAALPKIAWLSNTAVEITYAPGPAAADAKMPRMKTLDASKFVHVNFVAQE